MEMSKTTTITLTLTEAEARDYCVEMYKAEALLQNVDGGNTKTGLVTMCAIRHQLSSAGMNIDQAPPTTNSLNWLAAELQHWGVEPAVTSRTPGHP